MIHFNSIEEMLKYDLYVASGGELPLHEWRIFKFNPEPSLSEKLLGIDLF